MTLIITRIYADLVAAQAAVPSLGVRGHPDNDLNIISRHGDGKIADRMRTARVKTRRLWCSDAFNAEVLTFCDDGR